MRILLIYNEWQTYTSTVFEHLSAFQKYSKHEWFYLHFTKLISHSHLLKDFQAIFIHYSVRLPFDQISEKMGDLLIDFKGIKGVFIQDEYDNVLKTKSAIKKLKLNLIFTAVPDKSISTVYPKEEFPSQVFVNVFTGYTPENVQAIFKLNDMIPPSQRKVFIGYRGRELPIRYGELGKEKSSIGKNVKNLCKLENIPHDIEWDEQSRIYGKKWYEFIYSCKGMLGSESGSNVFDWNGDLVNNIDQYIQKNPHLSEEQIYESFIKAHEKPDLMNQISPRIFEMAAAGTIMILYEGSYSNVIQPGTHYLSLKKDLSNFASIVSTLKNGDLIDKMAYQTRLDIIESGKYNYDSFICKVDEALNKIAINFPFFANTPLQSTTRDSITTAPRQANPPFLSGNTSPLYKLAHKVYRSIWEHLPHPIRLFIKKAVGRV